MGSEAVAGVQYALSFLPLIGSALCVALFAIPSLSKSLLTPVHNWINAPSAASVYAQQNAELFSVVRDLQLAVEGLKSQNKAS